jgi:signal transduction histidine kinase
MARAGRSAPAMGLHRVATLIFALAVILPNLLLTYLLERAGLLDRSEAVLGLVVAVVLGLLGLGALRSVVNRIRRLARDLQGLDGPGVAEGLVRAGPLLIPETTEISEIAQIGQAFRRMIEDLKSATERLEDLVFKLGTLNETVELAARVPRIQDLLGLVLNNTMRAVRATIGSIMILDAERQTLRLVASRGLPADAAGVEEVRVGEGIAGLVVERGEPILVEDIESDPRFARPSAPHYGNGSFICMPIRAGDRVIGVLNMAKERALEPARTARSGPFSTIELQFLNTLMTYIGYSVDNARLLEEARRSAQRLRDVVADLRASQAAAVRSEALRAIGQLSSGVAHHLNNLLAVIIGRADLLMHRVEDPQVRKALDVVRRVGQDGADVVRRLQRFSRVEPLAQPVAVDLNHLAEDVVELTRPRWSDEAQLRGIRIDVTLDRGAVPPALGEPAPLREVVMNLVLNAVDALPRGGRIVIRTARDGDHLRFSVTDDGVGMSEQERARALEPFFTTKGPQSLGLGLSSAAGTIQRHGGTLTLDSAEGRGTTVSFTLSLAPEGASPEPAPSPPPGPLLRVLVIDDDPRVLLTLADLLSAQGHTVIQAASGQEGLERLEKGEPFDLVLTDLGMPGMTGWEVARAVRARWPGLRVGLITGWSDQDLPPQESGGVDVVISKPFDDGALRQALSSLFDPDRLRSPT